MLTLTLGLVIQSTPINVESPGIRLVNLIPKLASESRLSLSVVPYLENDVVAIRTMGRPWGEVKANLAKVLNATWEEKDGRFVLTQTSEQQTAERDFQRQTMIKLLTEKFANLKKFYSPTVWTEQEFNKWFLESVKKPSSEISPNARRVMEREIRRGSPQGRLTARILNQIEPSQLIPDDLDWDQHAYSTDKLVLNDYISIDLSEPLRMFEFEKQMYVDHKGLEEGELMTKPVGAIIRPLMLRENSAVTIDFYDKQGQPVDYYFDFDRSTTTLEVQQPKNVSRLSQLWKDMLEANAEMYEQNGDDGFVTPTGDPKTQARYLELVRKIRNRLKASRTEDPLALFGGDDWCQVSVEGNRPVIALLGDSISSALVASTESPVLRYGPYRQDEGEWILGSQRNLYATRRARANRDVLSKYADLVIKAGSRPEWFGIDGIFRRATALFEISEGKLDKLSRLSASGFEVSVENVDYLLLELLGAMTPDERLRLLQAKPIPLKSLGLTARKFFRENMFRDGFALTALDSRISSVAFPRVEEGLWLQAKAEQQRGYIYYTKSKDGYERLGEGTYDNLAFSVGTDSLPMQRDDLYLAPARSTKLTIWLNSAKKSVSQDVESAWTQEGAPQSLSSLGKSFLEELRKWHDKRSNGDGTDLR